MLCSIISTLQRKEMEVAQDWDYVNVVLTWVLFKMVIYCHFLNFFSFIVRLSLWEEKDTAFLLPGHYKLVYFLTITEEISKINTEYEEWVIQMLCKRLAETLYTWDDYADMECRTCVQISQQTGLFTVGTNTACLPTLSHMFGVPLKFSHMGRLEPRFSYRSLNTGVGAGLYPHLIF